MKKILIVDDNENNRKLLRIALEAYEPEDTTVSFEIEEAFSGIEAVAMCGLKAYDLVFMDIMMPGMDGIEATRRIRASDPKVLIIAVSAVDDTARQKEILLSGAEDYIPKPINIDIFNARLANYLALIASRRHHGSLRQAHNLFSREIHTRKLFFGIENEDDLAEFWEYYLLNTKMACALLSDTVRTFYALGSIALKCTLPLSIWVEESEGCLYFTMEGLEELDPKFIRLVLAKNPSVTDYRSDEDKISIRFVMEQCPAPELPVYVAPPSEAVQVAVSEPMVFAQTDAAENAVYEYMDEEDLEEIRGYISRLNSLLLVVGSGDLQAEEVEEIALYLERIGKVASIYSQSYSIGQALSHLSEDIRSHAAEFIDKSGALGPMCAAFSRDLMSWLRLIFEEGAPSVNYMDDTIITNAQMIGGMLKMDAVSEEAVDLDDIFDF